MIPEHTKCLWGPPTPSQPSLKGHPTALTGGETAQFEPHHKCKVNKLNRVGRCPAAWEVDSPSTPGQGRGFSTLSCSLPALRGLSFSTCAMTMAGGTSLFAGAGDSFMVPLLSAPLGREQGWAAGARPATGNSPCLRPSLRAAAAEGVAPSALSLQG